MYQQMSLLQFQQRFQSDADCAQYLFEKRWPQGFRCPRCECAQAYCLSKYRRYQCKRCRYQASLTAGTIFHRTRTPLRYWFWMIFLISRSKAGFSMLGMQRLLGMKSYQTVWTMTHKIRQAMADRNQRYHLQGLVEMDDAFFGGRRPKVRGRGAENKAKVLVMAENRGARPGFAAMQVVDKLDSQTVQTVAAHWIDPGERIKTDRYCSFNILSRGPYDHEQVYVDLPEQASVKFPWVHTVISNCKGQLQGVQRGVSLKHLHRFLAEFCYRFNRRFWERELFDRLLCACTLCPTVTYAELTG